ncbi:MAG: endonuclease III domain-containing protein [Candidatus Saganbacteria bacterium]|nr:endonuclease III domain-containing protein [Candidatus Saganbacteria bacterium]
MSKSKQAKLLKIYKKLLAHFGPQGWWPGDTPFEIMIGAILTQNTNWGNVERAIANLKQSNVLRPTSLVRIPNAKLEKLIRPAGYFRAKAKKLKIFCRWLIKQGGVKKLKKKPLNLLRPELLKVWGIGPETADSMLCYALDKTNFVVDAYTVRIFNRLGLIKTSDYHAIKDYFEQNLPKKLGVYKEYHALLVALGKHFCKKTKPLCKECPLKK